MQSLSDDLEMRIAELEFKRDGYIKRLETTTDDRACRRLLQQIADTRDELVSQRLALAATPARRGRDAANDEDFGSLCEVEIVDEAPVEEGVELELEIEDLDFEEQPTRIYRWPTARYRAVEERFVHSA